MGGVEHPEAALVAAVRVSRYEFAPVRVDECGRKYLELPDPLPKKIRRDDVSRVVGTGDSVHSLAALAYESLRDREEDIRPESFFDVIAEANDLIDVTEKLVNGTRIRIPSARAIQEEIRVAPRFFRRNTVT